MYSDLDMKKLRFSILKAIVPFVQHVTDAQQPLVSDLFSFEKKSVSLYILEALWLIKLKSTQGLNF